MKTDSYFVLELLFFFFFFFIIFFYSRIVFEIMLQSVCHIYAVLL